MTRGLTFQPFYWRVSIDYELIIFVVFFLEGFFFGPVMAISIFNELNIGMLVRGRKGGGEGVRFLWLCQ